MRINSLRLRAAGVAAAGAVALVLAAFAQGCARSATPTAGGRASSLAQTTPASSPTPAPSPALKSQLPAPRGLVNDFAEAIDARTEKLLEAKFVQLKQSAQIEFAVVTVETTGEDDIFDYSLALARQWGVGPPAGEGGGGILLLLAIKDRKWRLQVSRSLEADLPDDVAAELAKVMNDPLRAGRYGEAATLYADALIKRLAERRGFSLREGELIKTANREP